MLVVKLSVLLALAAGLMIYDKQSSALTDPIRDGLALLLTPVHNLAAIPSTINNWRVHLQSRESLIEDNDSLRHEHLRLNARLQKLLVLEAENQRIRALLDASKQLHDAVIIAEIQANSLDPYRKLIRVNRGRQDGIAEGQALIDANGVMGQVLTVTPYTATAVLITDENQGVPVEINRNGLQTVAHGTGGDRLRLPYLPENSDIEVGDLLVSSGLGGRYPAGYPVAMVEEIRHQPGEHFLEVIALPAASLGHGREVLLVRKGVPAPHTAQLLDPDAEPGRVAAAE